MRRITSHSRARRSSSAALRLCLVSLALAGGLTACAPQNTGTTYSSATMGMPAAVTYGVIKGTRPVTVQSGRSGVGTAAGAVAGGVAGSFIGGDWRSNVLGGLGGAVLGGLAGNAIERGTSTGQAIEFIIQQDNGGDIAVVQTNEDNLQVGDRVFITHGPDQVRIGRAIGAPPPSAGLSSRPVGAYAPK
ncbi:glycine zipper 2TM domain-containing protein [Roseomonas gilardii subsp. gilardii]|uniref:glycine zipper 2TM domain-containing protein n=1 Tax=Roseomonas gilardii TaxID=257708 RepID=UPI001FF84171|nr:glycine zipper 2TM domain-containing protein [Roseomonas gilardii]UPG73494.1 glycine zipper 2TM domain-containing protein [Roseomonas gilardii subsp. gilardii]